MARESEADAPARDAQQVAAARAAEQDARWKAEIVAAAVTEAAAYMATAASAAERAYAQEVTRAAAAVHVRALDPAAGWSEAGVDGTTRSAYPEETPRASP